MLSFEYNVRIGCHLAHPSSHLPPPSCLLLETQTAARLTFTTSPDTSRRVLFESAWQSSAAGNAAGKGQETSAADRMTSLQRVDRPFRSEREERV